MVDVAPIVLAVISAVVSVASVGFTGWISYYRDQVKIRSEAKALTAKYRDPLTQSAYDLQSRLFGIIDRDILDHMDDPQRKELVLHYTAFLIGQYFSWVYIFKRQAQFLRFSNDAVNRKLMLIMDQIANDFAMQRNDEGHAFMLWRGQQSAIGEVMTLVEENGQLYCMGFAAFVARYRTDEQFQHWFQAIEDGMIALSAARKQGNTIAANRLRRLQHLFIDLVRLIGSELLLHHLYPKAKAQRADPCECEDLECAAARQAHKAKQGA